MSRFPHVEVFQPIACRLGEGPCWHPQRQTMWWIDILAQRCFEAGLSGGPPRELDCGQMVGAIAPTHRGGLIAALQDGIYLLDPDSGVSTPFATAPLHDTKAFRFNDAKVDPRGRYWAGTLALDDRRGASRLYRIEADRSVAVMREGVSISNGLAWSPDGATLYYIDSPTRTVQTFPFDLERGMLGTPRVTIVLAEADGWPDGCAMDAEGCLWVAHWGAAKVTRWEPRTGRLLSTVALPVQNVTSCAFGGAALDQLFVTTAQNAAAGEPEAGYVFRLDPGVPGLAIANFAGG